MDTTTTSNDYVIDQVSWHTQTVGNPETIEHIERRFRSLAEFLKSNDLLSENACLPEITSPISPTYCIRSSHLTHFGLAVMKAGYDKWLRAIDRGKSPEDIKLLVTALQKTRSTPRA